MTVSDYLRAAARRNFMRARIRYLLKAHDRLSRAAIDLVGAARMQREIGGDVVRWYAITSAANQAIVLADEVAAYVDTAIDQLQEAKK